MNAVIELCSWIHGCISDGLLYNINMYNNACKHVKMRLEIKKKNECPVNATGTRNTSLKKTSF